MLDVGTGSGCLLVTCWRNCPVRQGSEPTSTQRRCKWHNMAPTAMGGWRAEWKLARSEIAGPPTYWLQIRRMFRQAIEA